MVNSIYVIADPLKLVPLSGKLNDPFYDSLTFMFLQLMKIEKRKYCFDLFSFNVYVIEDMDISCYSRFLRLL